MAPVRAILTIGHSTRPIEQFIELLKNHGIEELVDIRTIPRSRHNPQFSSEALAKALRSEGIAYAHLKELGGLRHPRHDSINTGWRNASFRGYADYMQSDEFEQGLRRLIELSKKKQCAVMCAEAVPWRCHRSLLADALVARGIPVRHIMSAGRSDAHALTPFAKIRDGTVVYPKTEGGGKGTREAGVQGKLNFGESEARMPRKKRKTKFTAAKEARHRARLAAGAPPTERVIADKRRKALKHKKPLRELAENAE